MAVEQARRSGSFASWMSLMVVGFLPTPAASALRPCYQRAPKHPQRICRPRESCAARRQSVVGSRILGYCARLVSPVPPPWRWLYPHWAGSKKQAYTIALFPLLDNAAQIDVASKRGLKRKAFPLAHARGDLFQHQPPSLQCCRFWCKRRKSCRDQIGIDESLALRFFREKRTSESRLPRAVRTSDVMTFLLMPQPAVGPRPLIGASLLLCNTFRASSLRGTVICSWRAATAREVSG